MQVLYFLSSLMVYVILIAAVLEVGLYIRLKGEIRSRSAIMVDSLRNILKGVEGTPDYDSTKSVHDEIGAILHFIGQMKTDNSPQYAKVLANAQKQDERKLGFGSFRIETMANVGAAMVQIFPLLGILGTILAIAESAAGSISESGVLDPAAVTSSFSVAMDTTILGIFFGIIFMLVDSTFQARVTELLEGSDRYRAFIDDIQLRGHSQ